MNFSDLLDYGKQIGYALWHVPDIRRMKKREFESVEALAAFAIDDPLARNLALTIQKHSELIGLGELVQALAPQRVVEIGIYRGGTLYCWTRLATDNAHIIGIDYHIHRWREPLMRAYARAQQTVEIWNFTSSYAPETAEKVKQAFGGKSIDFAFIDGDHTYEGVKADFDMYKPLMRSGGLMAFHDIVPDNQDPSCGVGQLWEELKSEYKYWEFIDDPKQRVMGIGVIEIP